MKEVKRKHDELCNTAINWLYARGCSVFAQEVPTRNGVADALGIVTYQGRERVYYVEAKASRSDLICPKQRGVYARSVEAFAQFCPLHIFKTQQDQAKTCEACIYRTRTYDNHIDYYYLIVADGVKVEDTLYPEWGVIDERGRVIRKAKRIKRTENFNHREYIQDIAHVLVYKVFGKLYSR